MWKFYWCSVLQLNVFAGSILNPVTTTRIFVSVTWCNVFITIPGLRFGLPLVKAVHMTITLCRNYTQTSQLWGNKKNMLVILGSQCYYNRWTKICNSGPWLYVEFKQFGSFLLWNVYYIIPVRYQSYTGIKCNKIFYTIILWCCYRQIYFNVWLIAYFLTPKQ